MYHEHAAKIATEARERSERLNNHQHTTPWYEVVNEELSFIHQKEVKGYFLPN